MTGLRWEGAALPILAVLGVALAIAAVLESRLPGTPRRRALRFLARAAGLALLAGAALEPVRERLVETARTLVVAVDRASSRAGGDDVARLLRDARTAAARDGAAVRAALFDDRLAPVEPDAPLPPPRAEDARVASRLSLALAWARGAIPAREAGAVVVLSDGRADDAGAADAAAALREAGVPVRAVLVPPAPARAAEPVSVAALAAPDRSSGPVEVRAALAGGAGARVARLLVDGTLRASREAAAGEDEVSFEVALAPGLHEVAVVAEDGAGGRAMRRTLVEVEPPPKALVVSADVEPPLARLLARQGFEVATVPAERVADALRAGRPDVVVLDADASPALREGAGALLAAVREGAGLVLLAGRSETAWAGLADSALAPALPLRPRAPPPPRPPERPPPEPPPPEPPAPEPEEEPKPEPGPGLTARRRPEEALPISLLLVIDRSGSMAGQKLALALLAAEGSAETLAPTDRVGVVAFADDAAVVLPFRPAGGGGISGTLRLSVEAQGSRTDLYAALLEAEKRMSAETSPIRHVLLVTDGRHNAGPFPPPDPVYRMADRGITVSTIGIGDDVDDFLLKRIARFGQGRFFFAPGPRDLPRVFTRDTQAVAERREREAEMQARLEEEGKRREEPAPPRERPEPPRPPPPSPPVPPPTPPPAPPPVAAALPLVVVRPHEALSGLAETPWPRTAALRPSDLARGGVALVTREDGVPALAAGRPGLGRVLAWAVPPDDAAAGSWPELPRLLVQAARAVVAPARPGPVASARVVHAQGEDALRVSVPEGADVAALARMRVAREGPDGAAPATFAGIEDGEAVFRLPALPPGASHGVVRARAEDAPEVGAMPPLAYLARGGAPEEAGPDPDRLARALGALADGADPGTWSVPRRSVPERTPLWPYLVAGALALLPLDAALHRRSRPEPRPAPRPAGGAA